MGFSKPPSWRTDHARAPWTSQAKTNDLNKRKEIKWDATCWALGRHVPAARGRGAGSGGPRRRHEQGEDATAVLRAAGIRASFINTARGRLQARGEARTRLRLNAAAALSANRRKPQRVCARLSRPQRAFAEPPARNLSPTPRRIQPPLRRS